jgi:hypothetical protein
MKNHVNPVVVYLAGYINGKVLNECISWRKKIVDHYENWKGKEDYPIVFLDPLNSKQYEDISEDGTTAIGIDPNAIVHRDYICVMRSDLIIANMDLFGENRIPLGTISEIAWAWDHKKPIVIISSNEMYHKHPFSRYFASFIVKDVDELLKRKILNYFFKGWNSAIYEKGA